MPQTLSEVVYHIPNSLTMTGVTLTLTRGATTLLSMVTATIAPAGSNAFHVISYLLPGSVPPSVTALDTTALWQGTVGGQAWSSSQSVTILQPLSLTPPLQAILVGSGEYTCGDTATTYRAVLSDQLGPVDLTTVPGGNLHIQYADGDAALPNQYVAAAAVSIADQTVPANLGLVSYSAPAATLTRQSKARHEVRMQLADGSVATFKGTQRLSLLLPYSTP
jgi:hypothetical protein